MCIACWVPQVTSTHSEYIVLTAFPQQQWLHEHALMLCWMYLAFFFGGGGGGGGEGVVLKQDLEDGCASAIS